MKYGICDINTAAPLYLKATFSQADALLGDSAPFLSVLEESPDNELHIRISAASVSEMEPQMLMGFQRRWPLLS